MTPTDGDQWPLGGPKHGYNGWVALMRVDYPENVNRHSPAWEILVEIQGIGLVSAWVGDHQRRTPIGEPVWVWKRQVTMNGKGEPLVRSMPEVRV